MIWQLPAQIVIGGTLPAFPNPSLSVNPAGDAITVTLNGSGLISASKPFGQAWQSPEMIPGSNTTNSSTAYANVSLDNQGNAIALWYIVD